MDIQNDIGEKIERMYSNFKKDGPERKNKRYKEKKLKYLKELWDEFQGNDNAIKLNAENDIEYDRFYERVQKIHTELCKALNAIVDNSSKSDDVEETASMEKELKRQDIRIKSLNRTIDEVRQKTSSGDEVSMAYCKTKLSKINEIWERITIANETIMVDEELVPGSYEDRYTDLEILVDLVQLTLQEKLDGQTGRAQNDRSEGIKLQRVTIPKFYGDYNKWVTFKDLFVSMVDSNKSYPNVQKFQILKTSVGGEAESLISDITVSDANYEDAWDRLLLRYDDNKSMVYKSINKLMMQPSVKGDSKSLKKLLDTTNQILLMLKNAGRPADMWDDWIIVVITQKLTDEIRKDWGKRISQSKELPEWIQLREFLEEEFKMLEELEQSPRRTSQTTNRHGVKSYQVAIDTEECPACKEGHSIWKCDKFKAMKVPKRWDMVRKNQLCFKCLSNEHDKTQCDREKPCKKCDRNHSTWLHEEKHKKKHQVNCATKGNGTTEKKGEDSKEINANVSILDNEIIDNVGAHATNQKEQVLLATAVVATADRFGRRILLRALIDSGSQGSMLTEEALAVLQYKAVNTSNRINPLGGGPSIAARSLTISIKPHFAGRYELEVECFILKKLTRTLPDHDLNTEKWNHIKGLQWADPRFYKVGPIDMLLGAEVVAEIMKAGLIRGKIGEPIAQQTSLGWIISGKIEEGYKKNISCCIAIANEEGSSLEKFWELEELNPARVLTSDEEKCEELFKSTYSRNNEGRFIVSIPFKDEGLGPKQLGMSKGQAAARFKQLERRLEKDASLKKEYTKVMNEYLTLGHMEEVTNQPESEKLYYIPHHAVIKPDSLTTKTRVVFDASAKTTTGVSFNECMHTGGKQQDDLFEIVIRWRKHRIVFKSDIEKMYRQILLSDQDQKYHIILWRNGPAEKLREFKMRVVTFGTAAAPFLATRCLKQIALDEQETYPEASQVIDQDFYVDDLISGADTVEKAVELHDQLVKSLGNGCMSLRKWSSNSAEFLETLPVESTEKALQTFTKDDEISKALGLQWNPRKDTFGFQVSWAVNEGAITKRLLLSEASKLFDPLGWLAPVVVNSKLLMQEIWLTKIGWDELVHDDIRDQWIKFRDDLPRLSEISIDRWVNLEPSDKCTLHGFGDASEKAYAAVVYLRVEKKDTVKVHIIASKTRVAPKATKTTLPRLELCSAVLTSNLLQKVQEAFKMGDIEKFAWSDSMITLGWLNGDPGRWKTFVANRVVEVKNHDIKEWNYVKSEDNPADCASRGLMPSELKSHKLWWTGPDWLKDNPSKWIKVPVSEPEMEKKKVKISVNAVTIGPKLIERFSSWKRAIRVISYCKRWKSKKKGSLTIEELDETKRDILKECQAEVFRKELKKLRKNEPVKRTSNILNLNPFIDENGMLRVGGRLRNSQLPEETKHPIILPAKHHVTKLIIREMHQETCHGGPQLMTTLLRKQFWIIQCKRMTNNEYKGCVICKRQAGKVADQLMGNLPEGRVTLERAFLHTGVDYTGAVAVRSSRLKSAREEKGYIALFVCFATKAIHLELVSDQSSDAFIAAMQRFMARRGVASDMYSDNGRNFVGASNALDKELVAVRNTELAEYGTTKGIRWHFIPPDSPTFGGLWERNIKSMKIHLKAILGTTKLTFEEYTTVLCQIEACLNSRPLCPLTDDPDNLNVLTPGHFLIGDALLAPPQRFLLNNATNNLHRWKFLQLLHQQFWTRWSSEYLTQLQQRYKWKEAAENLQVGDLVLIKDDDLPPRKWAMGKIMETHQGTDGLVRAASMKTENGVTKKGIQKICPLLARDGTELMEDSEPKKVSKPGDKKKSKYVITSTRILRPRPLRTGLWVALIAIMLMLGGGLAGPTSSKSPIVMTEFEHQPGIYFEDLGRAGVIRTEWHMYLYFDLKSYWQELDVTQEQYKRLRELCYSEPNYLSMHCNEICLQLKRRLNKIEERNELLTANGEHRQKRGAPLGFVGWIQHELFGVMDEEHADQIHDEIKAVKMDENHLKELIRNQTSIADVTADIMKSTEDEINRNNKKIKTALEALMNTTSVSRKREEFMGWAMYTQEVLNRFDKVQNDLINALTDLHQGHINSHLFTPKIFHEQLTIVYNNLPVGSTVPESPQDDLRSLYKLLRGKARVKTEMVVLDLILPLISTAEYQIYREIAIPIQVGNDRISIVPTSKYLMITLEKDNFYQMNDAEYSTCLKTKTKSICWIRHPIYNVQSNQSKCERELLAGNAVLSKSCNFEKSPETDVWIQLQQRNRWVYDLRKRLTLNVICDKEVFSVKVQGTGILEIQPGCEIVQPEMTITAEANKQSGKMLDFSPTLNLSSTAGEDRWTNLNLTLDHAAQLNNIHDQLRTLHDQTQIEQYHHVSHYTLNTGVIILIILGAGLLWIIRSRIKHLYETLMMSTSHVSNSAWRQWRIRQASSDVRRQVERSGDSRPVSGIGNTGIRMVEPLHSSRGEHVQSGHPIEIRGTI